MRWLLFSTILCMATFANANEEFDCKSPQDAFTKAVCSKYTNLKPSITYIASNVAPGKPVMPWIKAIAGHCKDDTDCIGHELLVEWLKFSLRSNDSQEIPANRKEICHDFEKLMAEELTNHISKIKNQSPTNPQHSIYFSIPAVSILKAYEKVGLILPSVEAIPYGMGADINRNVDVFPIISGGSTQTGFIIYDGGSLYCHAAYVAIFEKNTHKVDFLTGIADSCLNETGEFFTQKKHAFQVRTSHPLDGARYEIFTVQNNISKELCTVNGKMRLNYIVNANQCSLNLPACRLASQEAIRLAKYFDTHPNVHLDWKNENINNKNNRLMPNAIEKSLSQYQYPHSPSGLEIEPDQLAESGFEMRKYSILRPWQSFKLNDKEYLLSIIDGQYDFDGYIFVLDAFGKYSEGSDMAESEASIGLIIVKRELVAPISTDINYPK